MKLRNIILAIFIIAVILVSVYVIVSSTNSKAPQNQGSTTLMIAPDIPPPVPQDYAFNDTNQIQWKPDYHLKISDFTGQRNYTNPEVAWTTWKIIGTHFDMHFIGAYPNLKYSVSNIRIHGFFIRDQSWYKENKTICSNGTAEQLLQHEQGHFDLAEIFARKAYSEALNEFSNKTFSSEGNSPLAQQSNAYYSTWNKVQNIIDRLEKDNKQSDVVYEYYTKYGCNLQSQEAYNNYFKKLRE